jgi:hypothetical protein
MLRAGGGKMSKLVDILFIQLYILLVPIAFLIYIFMPDDPETKARCEELQREADMRRKND